MSTALEVIRRRRSVRDFTGQPLTDGQIQTLLEAAMQAPSCRNRRQGSYVVVRAPEALRSILTIHPYAKMLTSAGAAILVCGQPFEGEEREYWAQDASAAMENLLLAAEDMGLGAVWLGVYPLEQRVQGLRQLFSLPQEVIPLGVAAVGVPASHPEPVNRYDPSRVHFEKW